MPRRRSGVILLCAVAACGRLRFDPAGGDGGGLSNGDGVIANGDTMLAGDGAGSLGPWGTPMHEATLGVAGRADRTPSLTDDLLEIYFESNRNSPSTTDLFFASRASTTSAWSAPVELVALDSSQNDSSPEVSGDGLTLWFSSSRNGATVCSIYVSTRPDRTSAWSAPVIESSLDTANCDTDPGLADDGLAMIMTSGASTNEIWLATRAMPSGPFAAPAPVSELNVSIDHYAGSLRDSEREIYFDGCTGPTACAIFVATRATTADPFGAPAQVNLAGSGTNTADVWVSRDRRTMYFASDATGDMEIYFATR